MESVCIVQIRDSLEKPQIWITYVKMGQKKMYTYYTIHLVWIGSFDLKLDEVDVILF